MTGPESLVPLPVVLPLAVASAMLAIGHALPARVPDVVATLVSLCVAALAAVLAIKSQAGPLVYWFGGWTPRPDVVLGIGFGVDPASATVAGFIGLLFAATLVFAWGYFDEVHATFHVLMLLFLAAMQGFCLTRDLFNLFVWFEVMSVAAFALTAYKLETASLAGALTFTVTSSLASFALLGGVGLLYGRTGTLDFEALGRGVDAAGAHDPVVAGGFCLLALALLTKSAVVPLQFWLSDAHAVAPSPVSVIFSGAMVSLGLFGFAKITLHVFGRSDDAITLLRGWLMVLGCLTAVIGAVMAWAQRHLKRLLAFSTIAHVGVMLTGLAALSAPGVAGLLAYLVGHGLVKGALFMLVGVLLATKASVDELDLRGIGRDIWPAGLATAAAGLLLAGAPLGILHAGSHLIEAATSPIASGAVLAASLFATALTGAAVLRAAGRIYLGLGPDPGDQAQAPSQQEQENADRPLWLMLAPCLTLLALALAPAHLAEALGLRFAGSFAGSRTMLDAGAPAPASPLLPWLSVGLAVLIASWALARDRLPRGLLLASDRLVRPVVAGLNVLHSGLVGDYVLWMMVGLASFTLALAFG